MKTLFSMASVVDKRNYRSKCVVLLFSVVKIDFEITLFKFIEGICCSSIS